MRLIDADALLKEWNEAIKKMSQTADGACPVDFAEVISAVSKQPTINPEDLRPRGCWVGEGDGYADGELVFDVWYCSECGCCIDDGTDDPDMLPNYCPNCGAKMED